ncbi:MAG: hypothetical protein VX024_07755 [SAR324 cluster bacterium]|nr:hypothetical protein [SAR324 cluster bacterium]
MKVGDADLKAEDVYVITKGVEEIEVLEADIVYDRQGEMDFRPDLVRASHTAFELRNVIELEEEVLSANETYAWQIEAELPENAQYPFRGRFCQFSHLAQAGVSCFGNDPDSGWIEISQTSLKSMRVFPMDSRLSERPIKRCRLAHSRAYCDSGIRTWESK